MSTAEHADRVLVFDGGRIVEEGTHDELIAANGVYAGLFDSWLGNTQVDTSADSQAEVRSDPSAR